MFFLCLSSCKSWTNSSDEVAIAKANGNFLYPSDLIDLSYDNIDAQSWNQTQVDEWIRRQLWYEQAEKLNMDASLQKQLEDYKQSLLISKYQDQLLSESKIVISEDMILNYYKENGAAFVLEEELFKLQYFIVNDDERNINLIKELNNDQFPDYLKTHCEEHPDDCMLEPIWVGQVVLEDLQIPEYLWSASAKFQQYYGADNSVCMYRIESKKKGGEIAPLNEVKAEIVQILKFQLEKEILKKKEDELFLNAQNKKNFEIYK